MSPFHLFFKSSIKLDPSGLCQYLRKCKYRICQHLKDYIKLTFEKEKLWPHQVYKTSENILWRLRLRSSSHLQLTKKMQGYARPCAGTGTFPHLVTQMISGTKTLYLVSCCWDRDQEWILTILANETAMDLVRSICPANVSKNRNCTAVVFEGKQDREISYLQSGYWDWDRTIQKLIKRNSLFQIKYTH